MRSSEFVVCCHDLSSCFHSMPLRLCESFIAGLTPSNVQIVPDALLRNDIVGLSFVPVRSTSSCQFGQDTVMLADIEEGLALYNLGGWVPCNLSNPDGMDSGYGDLWIIFQGISVLGVIVFLTRCHEAMQGQDCCNTLSHKACELRPAVPGTRAQPASPACLFMAIYCPDIAPFHIVLQPGFGFTGCVEAISCVGIRLGHPNAYNYFVKNGGWIEFEDRADRVCGTDIMCERWFGASKN